MKTIRCIIIDDEPVARKIIREFVEQTPFLTLCGQFGNAADAGAFLQENQADLLFVDIEMPGSSGLDFVKSLAIKPMVVITTAFPEYALEGYELNIIDYLLKPIAYTRFLKATHKAKEYHDLKDLAIPQVLSSSLFVRCEKRIEKIGISDILYVESTGNYVHIYLEDRVLTAYLTLKSLESQLPANEFIKTHQSFLISFSKITAIDGNQLMVGKKAIPISRNYRDKLMSLIEKRLLKRT